MGGLFCLSITREYGRASRDNIYRNTKQRKSDTNKLI